MKCSERKINIIDNYVAYHIHTDYSLKDSATNYKDYVDQAVELGQHAIAFSEHGNIQGWVKKKMYCDLKGIKYIHAVECYLTKNHIDKIRDNYHTVLIAKNYEGVKELNRLISLSRTDKNHFYYVGRISFEEFLSLSDNIIKTSACLASPLNKLPVEDTWYEQLVKGYDYLEIQPHNCKEQIEYNRHLAYLSEKYHIPLIAATDAHSVNSYKAECRQVILDAKKQHYEGEDKMDLVYKSYDELVKAFATQDAIPSSLYIEAINNTNVMADSVEEFMLDTSIKYPILYGSAEKDEQKFTSLVYQKYQEKLDNGVISSEEKDRFDKAIPEELRVFKKVGMSGFMLSMSEILSHFRNQGKPIGFSRGSVGGSRTAYVTDIIDLNPEKWGTVFSRFCNEDRVEVGDIDVDVVESDRPEMFEYIINKFGKTKTARVPTYSTLKDLAAIDLIGQAFRLNWELSHPKTDFSECEYSIQKVKEIKQCFNADPDLARQKYPKLFYYYDGLLGIKHAQSVHSAGIVISPITLADNYGVFEKDGYCTLQIDMDEIHDVGLTKYDLLVLKTVQVISETCKFAHLPYPKSHEIDWDDQNVWESMLETTGSIFQFESPFAIDCLKKYKPKSILDMAIVTAAIRPSGSSYREELFKHIPHKNPSEVIDKLLNKNNGYLIFQEDTIKFLQEICGLSGSEADNVRRAIGHKDEKRLAKALPSILEGYCHKSNSPRNVAELEAKEFLQIIQDSASYQFGMNHAIGYCMISYLCAYYYYYYPYEFCTAYLNCAKNDEQIQTGEKAAKAKDIEITLPKFGISLGSYYFNKDLHAIAKGIGSVKFLSEEVATELFKVYNQQPTSFIDVIRLSDQETSVGLSKIEILIKIGFFDHYGVQSKLLYILATYQFFRASTGKGFRKNIKKSVLQTEHFELYDIVKNNSTDLKKDNTIKELFTIQNIDNILNGIETIANQMNFKSWNYKRIIQTQEEYLGYIDLTTHKAGDRQKLLVKNVYPLKNKQTNEEFAKRISYRSVGTGKEGSLTLKHYLFASLPLKQYDVIYVPLDGIYKDKKGYWNLTKYKLLN